jgi:hypothetical protein
MSSEAGWEVVSPRGRGVGFAKWPEVGVHLIGVYESEWDAKAGRVVTFRVSEITAPVFTKNGDGRDEQITPKAGDLINVGAHTADLRDKLTDDLMGREVYIEYVGMKPVKQGNMKLFQVKSRPAEEDGQEKGDDDLPF